MNDQEAFTVAAEHLLRQSERSVAEDSGACMYRGKEGLKCAVGILIPDEFYREDMEGLAVNDLMVKFPSIRQLFRDVNLDLLDELQGIHDSHMPKYWRRALHKLASRRLLALPEAGGLAE